MTREEALRNFIAIREALEIFDEHDVSLVDAVIDSLKPKYGEWIWHEYEDIVNCSNCGFEIDLENSMSPRNSLKRYKYCQNCGADMRGEGK